MNLTSRTGHGERFVMVVLGDKMHRNMYTQNIFFDCMHCYKTKLIESLSVFIANDPEI